MSNQKKWTKEEEDFLIEYYATMGATWCSQELHRSKYSISIKASRLNLKRNGDFRYDRPDAPDGYIACFHCKQILPEGQFYKKKSDGSYGKKTNLCRSCNQDNARRHYRTNKDKIHARLHKNPLKTILCNIKTRAKMNNIPFNLTEDDLYLPKYCPVLGIEIIPFDNSDHSPSVDRFIPELGYVRDNCRVISKRANHIKSNATFEEIEKLYNWMKINKK